MGTILSLKTTLFRTLKTCFLSIFLLAFVAGNAQTHSSGEKCFIKKTDPNTVNAKITWTYNPGDQTYTIRTTFSKGFVDNTYGTNAIGWGTKGHTFDNLVGSDHVQLVLNDKNGVKKMEFKIDYISQDNTSPSGYGSLGVTGGEGKMLVGSSSDVVSATTSLDENLNTRGCPQFTTNSPATDANYSPSTECPSWIYEVWYEVKVKASAFPSGLGSPYISGVHASPSKTGSNTEIVEEGPCPGSLKLGNLVWNDANQNGMKDASESPLSGMGVKLYKDGNSTAIASTTTDASGMYYFSNLQPGSYSVGVTKSGGYNKSPVGFSNPDNNTDNDNNGVNDAGNEVKTNNITLSLGGEPSDGGNTNSTLDVGLYKDNQAPNGGEFCFASPTKGECVNARVQYSTVGDNTTIRVIFSKCFVDNTYGTNAIGWGTRGHTFSNLTGSDNVGMALYDAAGAKKLEFKLDYFSANASASSGYQSLGVAGGDGDMIFGNESDILSWKTSMDENFNTYGYKLTTNSPATDANYSPNPTYPNWIYDVWYEVTVKSSAFGTSGFGTVLIPSVHASPSKTGNNTEIVEPKDCPSVLNLGNLVFSDKNANGVFDNGIDAGISGATVNLYKDANGDNNPDGGSFSSTTTNSSGIYKFTGLAAGNYIVGVVTPIDMIATGTVTTSASPNNDVDNDNNGVRTVGNELRTNFITLSVLTEPTNDGDGANGNLTLDLGFKEKPTQIALPVSLGDRVWNDVNGNGIQDAGEAGMPGVTVKLYKDADGNNIPDGGTFSSTTTNSSGFYTFNNLDEGKYMIGVMLPDNYGPTNTTSTSANPDNNVVNDNNGIVTWNNMEVQTNSITLTSNGETNDGDNDANRNPTLDVGLLICGGLVIGDFVWEDTNGNGLQDGDEYGIGNVAVTLWLPDGSSRVILTDANGGYLFTGLNPGTYNVCFQTPAGYRATTPNAGNDKLDSDPVNGCYSVTISGTFGTVDADAGFVLVKMNLGNMVYFDQNEDGVWQAGEPGIPGVVVQLFRDNNADNMPDGLFIAQTTTDINGKYIFPNLSSGRYIVGIVLPNSNWQDGPVPFTGINPNNNVDHDNNGIVTYNNQVFSFFITLTPGGEPGTVNDGDGTDGNLTLDFGLTRCPDNEEGLITLGNMVFNDFNNNGRYDANEPVMSDARVNLYRDANGDNVPDGLPIDFTYTSGEGIYTFTNLTAGNYIVGVVLPQGFIGGSGGNTTPNNDVDGDNNGVRTVSGEVRSNYITLNYGSEPTTDGDGNNSNLTLDFALVEQGTIILPISLLQFSGVANGNTSVLTWKVAYESDMRGYVIEKSLDGSTFTDAGGVNALNTAAPHSYSHADVNSTNASVIYYRLRSESLNGGSAYSNIVAVKFGQGVRNGIIVYPNPAKDYIVMNIAVDENAKGIIQVINATGQAVMNKGIGLSEGNNSITLDGLSKFAKGSYNISVKLDNGQQYHKTILLVD